MHALNPAIASVTRCVNGGWTLGIFDAKCWISSRDGLSNMAVQESKKIVCRQCSRLLMAYAAFAECACEGVHIAG
jgi:hypothetical protein